MRLGNRLVRYQSNCVLRHAPIVQAVIATFLFAGTIGSAIADTTDAGEKLFKVCKACHEIGEGAHNKVGPHLDGIIGRTAGTVSGFNYSKAMLEAGTSGLKWDHENLAKYLERPRDFIAGNRMSYRGMADTKDRETLIAWLGKASSAKAAVDPKALPVAVPISAEARSFTDIVLAQKGDPEYGEYLAGECVTCHQSSGHADGIPSIVGLPADYFVHALFEYKTNVRRNEVMKLRVVNLTNEEIAALAAYFSKLEPK
ncbi:MAG: c-type cytochrome [Hyphomicrobiaceae bacterium]|nr:c-type cytochrome [Hyphomicrobiaceae bacterium]